MCGTGFDEAQQLRATAEELRRVAARLESCRALTLHVDAGETTWRGPGPELCRRLLAGNQHQLRLAAEELRHRAVWSEQRATEVEVQAALGNVAR